MPMGVDDTVTLISDDDAEPTSCTPTLPEKDMPLLTAGSSTQELQAGDVAISQATAEVRSHTVEDAAVTAAIQESAAEFAEPPGKVSAADPPEGMPSRATPDRANADEDEDSFDVADYKDS